ncbi:hypothetical protein [Pseudoduganella violacea]|uniref:Uncharacterized protein n=1 Tax=Pseudoduganella violacea TaxID=1715466 RepID=A0A7W5BCK8_9BURK|nr:hypothetical protein [Pseudoduganella violacea]MBB3120401.1 hypothetical protein [Pseudoduganella violacea]
MKTMALAIAAALALTACASPEQARITEIAGTPLRDLNISKPEIPAALREALDKPYATPAQQDCPSLASQVDTLDDLLGPDIDAPEEKQGRTEMARDMASKAATGALQNTVEGAIPFRGWLRKLSGAERHSKEVQNALLAGKIRRGFLKGVMQTRACSLA